jgi:hypothetical protein
MDGHLLTGGGGRCLGEQGGGPVHLRGDHDILNRGRGGFSLLHVTDGRMDRTAYAPRLSRWPSKCLIL